MSPRVMDATLDFILRIVDETGQRKVKLTFHGGEPLLAGHDLWRHALKGLDRRLGRDRCDVALQSNLWLLDNEFCQLFTEHKIEIGTSLDGAEDITDHQRGHGYFARTMQGIRKANCFGLNVGCIATFTPFGASRWREVFDFFLAERLDFSIHAAVPPLDFGDGQYALSPREYGTLLCEMLDRYVEHRREICVSSLDQMCQGFGSGGGKVCTFRDCLGMFLAIDPYGDIYPCQRFSGKPAYRLGNVAGQPAFADLLASQAAVRMDKREKQMRSACTGCSHYNYCKGGCPYNAWACEGSDGARDPNCPAYKQIFDKIADRVMAEMASAENIEAVAARPYRGRGHPLLREGPLIELVREGPHPKRIARTAKRIVAVVELARGPDMSAVAARLVRMGICRTQQSAQASLAGLQRDLQPKPGLLNNLYLHVTFACQLHCTHCYARADAAGHLRGQMGVAAVVLLARQAKEAGFRQVIVTGGEPLVHTLRDELLAALQQVRREVAPLKLVVRTNFALPLDVKDLLSIALAFSELVVSVDGTPETHDRRRGAGSYAATLKNLQAYLRVAEDLPAAGELALATVMQAEDLDGEPGDSVRALAQQLGIRRTRFRPLLPLGRASEGDDRSIFAAYQGHPDASELTESGFHPINNCGLGQNLYVEPPGDSFPCYACREPDSYLGNVIESGLTSVLSSDRFQRLSGKTVDTTPTCCECDVRYLCGGACLAWRHLSTGLNCGGASIECPGFGRRAAALLEAAQRGLGIQQNSTKKTDT